MFNKYAELRKIAILYRACRGLLRMKMAEMAMPNWNTFIGNIGNFDPSKTDASKLFGTLSKGQADEFMGRLNEGNSTQRGYAQQLQSAYDKAYSTAAPAAGGAAAPAAGGAAAPAAAPSGGGTAPAAAPSGGAGSGEYKFNADYFTPEQQQALQARGIAYSNVNPEQAKRIASGESVESVFGAKPAAPAAGGAAAPAAAPSGGGTAPAAGGTARKPVNPLQLKMMSQQRYMQNHQRQIQQAGQQAQQNATKGWFGKALNWLTGGGYGGWAAGRAQAQKQRYYNNRYQQQSAALKQRQQKARQRITAQQIQNWAMNLPHNKAAGYSLLNLFPGYRQLFNYV